MTNQQLQAIRTRLKAATPGPWEYETIPDQPHTVWAGNGDIPVCDLASHVLRSASEWFVQADATFIAHSVTDVADILQELDIATNAIHDLQQSEKAYQLGYQAGIQWTKDIALAQILHHRIMEDYHSHQEGLDNSMRLRHRHNAESLDSLIRRLGTTPEPLLPQQLREENERLRQALTQVVEILEPCINQPGRWRSEKAYEIAQNALGEDTPEPTPPQSS